MAIATLLQSIQIFGAVAMDGAPDSGQALPWLQVKSGSNEALGEI